MCGRYYVDRDDDREIRKIIDQISDIFRNEPEIKKLKTGEVYPTNTAPVITGDSPALMKWGFSRYDGKGHIINCRLETAHEKVTFKKPYMQSRCLLPASCYFEWEKRENKKQKMMIRTDDTLYLAGLYRQERDSSIPVFVILTMPARSQIKSIHDRMPVIIPEAWRRDWLEYKVGNSDLLAMPENKLTYKEA